MRDLRKRILLELFITPFTVVPFLFGTSLLLLSEVLGGYAAFMGFVSLLVSLGAFLTNLLFNLENISEKAVTQIQNQKVRDKERTLDDLDQKLQKTDGDDDEISLRNLRLLYQAFCVDISEKKINQYVPSELLVAVDDIFNACIVKLGRSFEIWNMAGKMAGTLKRQLLKQRKDLVADVEKSVAELANVINEIRALQFKSEKDELERLQNKLNSQLEIAKATEEEMASILGNRDAELE